MKRLFVTIIMLLAFLPISAHGLDQDPHKGVGRAEIILKQGTQYAFIVTASTNNDDIHNITLWWYEHTNR